MSHEYHDKRLHFVCDTRGCRKNFECEENEFRVGWREAKAHGWSNYRDYSDRIVSWKNACPECSKKLGE